MIIFSKYFFYKTKEKQSMKDKNIFYKLNILELPDEILKSMNEKEETLNNLIFEILYKGAY